MKRIFLYLFFLTTIISRAHCQDDHTFYSFHHLTREDGLAHNNVECIFQDSDDLIWFGTRNGLCQFDGYEIKTFRADNNNNSVSGNWILSINEDSEGNLWIGTALNGVNKFDKKKNIFKKYDSNNNGIGNRINKIEVLANGMVLLCTDNGLAKYQKETDDFFVYLPDPDNPNSLNSSSVYDLIQSSDNTCYLTSFHPDIQIFNPEKGTFKSISYLKSSEYNSDYKKRISEDSDGNLWITANQHGLVKLNPKTGKSELFLSNDGGLGSNILNGSLAVEDNKLWIATDGDGINILNPTDNSFEYLNTKYTDNSNIPGNQIYNLYVDNQNTIWLALYGKGVAYYNPLSSKFKKSLFKQADLEICKGKSVISLFEDSKKRVWIGTDGWGLYLFEKNRDPKIFTSDDRNPNSLSSNVITSIGEDEKGNILIGTFSAGFNIIDRKTYSVSRFIQTGDSFGPSSSNVWDILMDSKQRIWLGLLGQGLDLYDPELKIFKNFGPESEDLNRINNQNTMVIMEDTDGDMWFGTEGNGVFILDGQTGKLTRMLKNSSDSSLLHSVIRSLFQDKKGQIWIGTEGEGLFVFQKKSGELKNYWIKDGLPDMIVQGILEDEYEKYWISTSNGLSRFSPENQEFVNFSASDGLSANDFNPDAFIQISDGRFILGSKEGIDIFHADEIHLNQNIPNVILTKFSILNEEINAGDTINGRVPLTKEISYTSELELSHKDKIIAIEFAALNYTKSEKCKYKYKLEGLDPEWVELTSDRRIASYSNLKQGEYVFKIKASNNDGKWGDNVRELKIIVLPPFWNTWWFYSLMGMIVMALIFLLYKTRLNYYKKEFQRRQTIQEKRIIELEKENLESELKKLTFFRLNRNRVLLSLKMRLEGLSVKASDRVKGGLEKVIQEIDNQISSEIDWKYIEPQLDRTYNNFLTKLREKHSDLSASELKIAAYVRMNLGTKEMSEFMHKTVRAIENDRYRLRKKLNLESNDSLQNYLMNL